MIWLVNLAPIWFNQLWSNENRTIIHRSQHNNAIYWLWNVVSISFIYFVLIYLKLIINCACYCLLSTIQYSQYPTDIYCTFLAKWQKPVNVNVKNIKEGFRRINNEFILSLPPHELLLLLINIPAEVTKIASCILIHFRYFLIHPTYAYLFATMVVQKAQLRMLTYYLWHHNLLNAVALFEGSFS